MSKSVHATYLSKHTVGTPIPITQLALIASRGQGTLNSPLESFAISRRFCYTGIGPWGYDLYKLSSKVNLQRPQCHCAESPSDQLQNLSVPWFIYNHVHTSSLIF